MFSPGLKLAVTALREMCAQLQSLQVSSKEDRLAYLMSYARRQGFVAAGKTWIARSHSVLLGHEDWVNSVAWCPEGAHGRAASGLHEHSFGSPRSPSLGETSGKVRLPGLIERTSQVLCLTRPQK
jgi:hypothetical protein